MLQNRKYKLHQDFLWKREVIIFLNLSSHGYTLLPLLWENRNRRGMLGSHELVYVEHHHGNLTFQMNQS